MIKENAERKKWADPMDTTWRKFFNGPAKNSMKTETGRATEEIDTSPKARDQEES